MFSNPVFLYCFSFIFEKDSTGSIVTRILYIMFGGLAPIVVIILMVVEKTVDIGKTLRWVFYILPIFSLDFGVVNLAE
jgi:uncharacterized membrane protein YhaH (DUF805 family)